MKRKTKSWKEFFHPDISSNMTPWMSFKLKVFMVVEALRVLFETILSFKNKIGSKYGIPDFFGFQPIQYGSGKFPHEFVNPNINARMTLVGLRPFLESPSALRSFDEHGVFLEDVSYTKILEHAELNKMHVDKEDFNPDEGWGLILEITYNGYKSVTVFTLPSLKEFRECIRVMGVSMIPQSYVRTLDVAQLLWGMGFKELIPTRLHQQDERFNYEQEYNSKNRDDYEEYNDIPIIRNLEPEYKLRSFYNQHIGSQTALIYAIIRRVKDNWVRVQRQRENGKFTVLDFVVEDSKKRESIFESEGKHMKTLFPSLSTPLPDSFPNPKIQTVYLGYIPRSLEELLATVPIRIHSYGIRDEIGQFIRFLVYSRDPIFDSQRDEELLHNASLQELKEAFDHTRFLIDDSEQEKSNEETLDELIDKIPEDPESEK